MPPQKSDLHIHITLFDKSFSISGKHIHKGHWKIKRGRSWASKTPYATTTQIFKKCLAWVVSCGASNAHKARQCN